MSHSYPYVESVVENDYILLSETTKQFELRGEFDIQIFFFVVVVYSILNAIKCLVGRI